MALLFFAQLKDKEKMKTVSEISAAIVVLNVFQIQELDKVIKARMSEFKLPDTSVVPVPVIRGSTRSKFKIGDIVEFFSSRTHTNVKVRIEKINSVNLSCRAIDAPFTKWRVAPSFCQLVGDDKSATFPEIDVTVGAMSASTSTPTAAGAGAW